MQALRDAYLSADLLRSGPGLWPFGRRARDRRVHNRAVAEEAQRRRDQIRSAFDTGVAGSPTTRGATDDHHVREQQRTGRSGELSDRSDLGDQWPAERLVGRRPVDRRTHTLVVLGLATMVTAVVIAALWWRGPDPYASSTASDAASSPSTGLSSTTTPISTTTNAPTRTDVGSLEAQPPIPPDGVDPVGSGTNTTVDVGSVRIVAPPVGDPTPNELGTPEAAMRAWLARLCPFSSSDEFGAAEQRARAAMTDNGWATLNPFIHDERGQRARASWDNTVAAGESGRCADPATQISAEAPRSATSAIVIGAVDRVVTATGATGGKAGQDAYVEQLSAVRVVRRGANGLWRVDLAAAGG